MAVDMPLAIAISAASFSGAAVAITAIKVKFRNGNGNGKLPKGELSKYVQKETCVETVKRIETVIQGQTSTLCTRMKAVEDSVKGLTKKLP